MSRNEDVTILRFLLYGYFERFIFKVSKSGSFRPFNNRKPKLKTNKECSGVYKIFPTAQLLLKHIDILKISDFE